MWYEIFPAFGIIWLSMGAAPMSAFYINKLLVDNYYRRRLLSRTERLNYIRDYRITGSPYVLQYLDCISDVDPAEEAAKKAGCVPEVTEEGECICVPIEKEE